MKIKTQVRNNH